MEKYLKEYALWDKAILPLDLREELNLIKEDKGELKDRFCKYISFGTSGMRGRMGVGSNRINSFTLTKATLGVSRYLRDKYEEATLVIGYDTRINSKEYAEIVAKVLSDRGINVFLFSEPTPVPVVSFTIRNLSLNGGIMITASHNTKEYNGYKVYDHYGNQIDETKALIIENLINVENIFEENYEDRKISPDNKGFIRNVPKSVNTAYFAALKDNIIKFNSGLTEEGLRKLKICYTPLNGTGRNFVPIALRNLGISDDNLFIVKRQWNSDGSFPTCPSPNPENSQVFSESIKYIREESKDGSLPDLIPHIIIATDPDCDRMGLQVFHEGEYVHLNGNQVGSLMFDYICRNQVVNLNAKAGEKLAFKSHVTTPLVESIGDKYGVKVRSVFTGFKNIAYEMEQLNKRGQGDRFLFAFEESIGYLYGDYTRDKDGVMAAQLAVLMAGELLSKGKTLVDRLEEIFQEYGYLETITNAIIYKKEEDRETMNNLVKDLFGGLLRNNSKEFILRSESCYEEKNMYIGDFEEGHRVIVRPSGTELKLKIYIFAKGDSLAEAIDSAAKLSNLMRKLLDRGER